MQDFPVARRAFDGRMHLCASCVASGVLRNPVTAAEYERRRDALKAKSPNGRASRAAYATSLQGMERSAAAKARWRRRNPEKYAAQTAVGNAVRSGRLNKPDRCACGSAHRIHAHHDDYKQPLKVEWLCDACHKRAHQREI